MSSVQHANRKHALLSASGASRWINCTPSARLEEPIKDEGSSIFAQEGTLAHELADIEIKLKSYTGSTAKGSAYDQLKKEKAELEKHELYQSEMDEHIDKYVSYVLEQFYAAKKKTADAVLKVEERTDYSYLVPEGFGTSDANIIADGVLEIVDLKYGKGLKVEAIGNAQLRLYALGLLRKFEMLYDIDTVKMTIVQPRLDHIDSEVLKVSDLEQWAKEVVVPAAAKAFKGEGDCNPGSWCKWCKVKPRCKALADKNLELAKMEFADPKLLTDEQVLAAYGQTDLLIDWANSVASYMLDTALQGKKWEGYKVVEGRSNRKWADEQAAIKKLKEEFKLKIDEIVNTKIKGIGDIEKKVGKGKVNDLLIKPPGKPTLVEESDKRTALGADKAKEEFKNFS